MDHGFTTPFDLDSLRNKVDERFESVDKLSKGESLYHCVLDPRTPPHIHLCQAIDPCININQLNVILKTIAIFFSHTEASSSMDSDLAV